MDNRTASEEAIKSHIPFLTPAALCDRNARRFPDKEALVDARKRLTWGDVRLLSNKLAVTLIEMGLSRSRPLLLQLPNCVELFLARLACEKAGVACVTVSPFFKAGELTQILRHTRPAAAMVFRTYRSLEFLSAIQKADHAGNLEFLIAGDDVPKGMTALDEIFEREMAPSRPVEALRGRNFTPLDSCQIATTSGSSGLPKCVEVSIYSRLLTGDAHAKRFKLGGADTIAPFGPIISGTSEALGYFGTSLLGSRAVLIDLFDPEVVLHRVAAEEVTFACLVPTMMAKIADVLADRIWRPEKLKGLVTYGSLLPIPVAEKMERLLGVKIVQAYGTMDFGGISATFADDKLDVRIGTVGRPLDGNDVIICGEHDEPVARGEEGRIRVRGIHAVGKYYNAPELDNEKWRHGYFDVGEIGRFDQDGNLILLGRSDNMIIRGGQNIYPQDIEALLLRHPDIQEAAVIGVPDPIYGQRVCAFVAPKPGREISSSEILAFLKGSEVASFKIPEMIEILPDLPRAPSGEKVNRRELVRMAQRRQGDSYGSDH